MLHSVVLYSVSTPPPTVSHPFVSPGHSRRHLITNHITLITFKYPLSRREQKSQKLQKINQINHSGDKPQAVCVIIDTILIGFANHISSDFHTILSTNIRQSEKIVVSS